MRCEALSWFKWMYYNQKLGDWVPFSHALETRFGPSSYENHQPTLFKLKQTGTVTDYQAAFEKLNNQVLGLGLQPDIQRDLAILKPQTVSQTMGLAKLIEDKLKDHKTKPFRSSSFSSSTSHTTNQKPIPTIPIKRLTSQQMQERRDAGLCYNCDEKFFPGHKCATPRFFLLLCDKDLSNPGLVPDSILPMGEPALHFQLSPQALASSPSPQTLKFHGSILGLPVMVLIDIGSSHNIIQPHLAMHLQLPTHPMSPFKVMVGNGAHILCHEYCPKVPILLQSYAIEAPLYILPIKGADVVLGTAWLRTLGSVQADFSIPSFTFSHNETPITILGESSLTPTQASFHQNFHLMHKTAPLNPYPTITLTPSSGPSHPTFQSTVSTLLETFSHIFQPPHGLPHPRPHGHKIPLLPNSAPVNIKPYHYPHSHKDIMSSLIATMLSDGVIKPSTSPFSSLVLLVDILVYSDSFDSHAHHLHIVFQLLLSNQFYAKLSKCVFGVTSVAYLGHVIIGQGVSPNLDKIQAILDWPAPRSLSALRGFLGLIGFYRRFVKHYAAIATPLTDLHKCQHFTWTAVAQIAFTTLQSCMTTTPVLSLPVFKSSFVLETNASATTIGAVLS
uniref:Reverse transcriptase/retrotransposon-derived protein RNase H-like domain-containing protein n=1 Tax=Cajanus cajan TaxID=3821 RepID=A0A151RTP2_CAJCA|nr:hypothetical protein KK1_032523 [Cajanus cajan]